MTLISLTSVPSSVRSGDRSGRPREEVGLVRPSSKIKVRQSTTDCNHRDTTKYSGLSRSGNKIPFVREESEMVG